MRMFSVAEILLLVSDFYVMSHFKIWTFGQQCKVALYSKEIQYMEDTAQCKDMLRDFSIHDDNHFKPEITLECKIIRFCGYLSTIHGEILAKES